MITIDSIETTSNRRRFIRDFIDVPKRIYRGDPFWLPWFDRDIKAIVHKQHPFFEHSHGQFFVAYRNAVPVGRIGIVHNTRYCRYQDKQVAHFCFIDFEDDADIVKRLFEAGAAWARARKLALLEGPMFAGGIYGSGLLVKGFDSSPPMTMMSYNHPYYEGRILEAGFTKWIDLYSATLDPATFVLPEKVERVADLVRKRSDFSVLRFKNKREIRAISQDIGRVVNDSIGMYAEDYPLTEKEVTRITSELLEIARPEFIKILTHRESIVGFLFTFPDLSNALRKNNGKITPLGILRLLREMRSADRLIINGMGILSEYRRRGGNALLYAELSSTVKDSGFESSELVQISEQTDMMLKDLQSLGADFYKTYRMYTRSV
jgi:hypothetical protein